VNFFPALVTEEHPLEIKDTLSTEVLGLNGASARAEQPIQIEKGRGELSRHRLGDNHAFSAVRALRGMAAVADPRQGGTLF
jgi:hypothetical protein